jgi:hypothetical protein
MKLTIGFAAGIPHTTTTTNSKSRRHFFVLGLLLLPNSGATTFANFGNWRD